MIKIFRRIRQRLLSEGKTAKYVKYALGEIFLVVIGILIALSINNWNEENKRYKEEKKLIAAVVKEVESNIEKLKESMSVNESCAQRSNTFIEDASSNKNFKIESKPRQQQENMNDLLRSKLKKPTNV